MHKKKVTFTVEAFPKINFSIVLCFLFFLQALTHHEIQSPLLEKIDNTSPSPTSKVRKNYVRLIFNYLILYKFLIIHFIFYQRHGF